MVILGRRRRVNTSFMPTPCRNLLKPTQIIRQVSVNTHVLMQRGVKVSAIRSWSNVHTLQVNMRPRRTDSLPGVYIATSVFDVRSASTLANHSKTGHPFQSLDLTGAKVDNPFLLLALLPKTFSNSLTSDRLCMALVHICMMISWETQSE